MRVVVKAPGQLPEIREIGDRLEEKQRVVGGLLQVVSFGPEDEFDLWLNEEGLLLELEPNLLVAGNLIRGPVFICACDAEGRSVGLTEPECRVVIALLKETEIHPVVCEKAFVYAVGIVKMPEGSTFTFYYSVPEGTRGLEVQREGLRMVLLAQPLKAANQAAAPIESRLERILLRDAADAARWRRTEDSGIPFSNRMPQ